MSSDLKLALFTNYSMPISQKTPPFSKDFCSPSTAKYYAKQA